MLTRPIQIQDSEIQELLRENKRLLGICSAPISLLSWLSFYYGITGGLGAKFNLQQKLRDDFKEMVRANPQRVLNVNKAWNDFLNSYLQAGLTNGDVEKFGRTSDIKKALSVFLSVTKPLIFNSLSLKAYQKFFTSADKKPVKLFNHQNDQLIKDIKRQNNQLEKIANRNITFARYSMFIIIPLAIYWMMFEREKYILSADRMVDFFAIVTVSLSIFNLARENLIKDVTQAWNDYQLNVELAEVEKKIKGMITDDQILNINLHADRCIEKSNIDVIFKSKTARKLVIKELIKSILINHGVDIVASDYDTLTISALSIKKISYTEIEKVRAEILAKIIMVEETETFSMQVRKFAKINNIVVTCIPRYNNQGQRNIDCYFDSNSNDLLSNLYNIFPSALITKLDNKIQMFGNQPCDKQTFDLIVQAIQKPELKINSDCMLFSDSQSHMNKSKDKTPRNVTKKIEREKEKTMISVEETTQSSLKRAVFQSGTYDSDNSRCKATVLSGVGLPYGRFYITSSLTKNDFPNNDEAFGKFREKMERSKKANARQNAEGIVFIDPVEVKCDNKDASFVAEAKIKFKGAHGDMRVYMRKESNNEGKVLYIAEGVKMKAHK